MSQILNIVGGPERLDFHSMMQFDWSDRWATFNTKEKGEIDMECDSIGIDPSKENDIEVSNSKYKVVYNSTTKTGTLEIL